MKSTEPAAIYLNFVGYIHGVVNISNVQEYFLELMRVYFSSLWENEIRRELLVSRLDDHKEPNTNYEIFTRAIDTIVT